MKINLLLLALLATSCSSDDPPTDVRTPATPSVTQPAAQPAIEPAPAPMPAPILPGEATLVVTSLNENQEITESTPVLFRITASTEIHAVQVTSNGKELGAATAGSAKHRFETSFAEAGEFVLEFIGLNKRRKPPLRSNTECGLSPSRCRHRPPYAAVFSTPMC